ncbi:terminase gpA endonuclease subunit [Pantoea stewartii]|uniref:terminase gpA endonuclease subunit n=1 Tax=Pantoea stewartii TaxID=66269 RepID=UPI0036354459
MGLPYEDSGEKALSEKKLGRTYRSVWRAKCRTGRCAANGWHRYAGTGVWKCEVKAGARNEESWSIAYDVIEGDMDTPEPWDRLDAYLKQVCVALTVEASRLWRPVSTQAGITRKRVHIAKERIGRRIWAIKGESARNGKRSPVC